MIMRRAGCGAWRQRACAAGGRAGARRRGPARRRWAPAHHAAGAAAPHQGWQALGAGAAEAVCACLLSLASQWAPLACRTASCRGTSTGAHLPAISGLSRFGPPGRPVNRCRAAATDRVCTCLLFLPPSVRSSGTARCAPAHYMHEATCMRSLLHVC